MAEQEGKTIHSVAKAIRLLDILTESGQPASLTELYQKTCLLYTSPSPRDS